MLEIDNVSKESVSKGIKPIIDFDFDLKISAQRCLSCVLFLLEQNENAGHTKMDIIELKHQCDRMVPACAYHFVSALKEDCLYYSKEYRIAAIKTTYETERYIAENIVKSLKISNVWEYDVHKYKNETQYEMSDEQLQALDYLCKHNISILNGCAGCVDKDTEFFNGRQWKKISEYDVTDMVLQYNEDNTSSLVIPRKYIKNPKEYLWQFSTKYGLDQCLSESHNVYYITSKNNLYSKTFREVMDNQNNTKRGFNGKFITSFINNGRGIDLTEYQIRLMVAVIADGSFFTNRKGKTTRFHLKKKRKKDRLINIINNLNINYKEKTSSCVGYMDYYCEAPIRTREFPLDWYDCTQEQLQIIADEVLHWDGCVVDGRRIFVSTSKINADFVQWVFTAIGKRAVISTFDRRGRKRVLNNTEYTTLIGCLR